MSHDLDSRPPHPIVDLDAALRRAVGLMPGKRHDRRGRDAAVGELGDKAAPPARRLRIDGDAPGALVVPRTGITQCVENRRLRFP